MSLSEKKASPVPPSSPSSSTNVFSHLVSPPSSSHLHSSSPTTPSPNTPSPNTVRASARSPKRPRTPQKPLAPLHAMQSSSSTSLSACTPAGRGSTSTSTTATHRPTMRQTLARRCSDANSTNAVASSMAARLSPSRVAKPRVSRSSPAARSLRALAPGGKAPPIMRNLATEFDAVARPDATPPTEPDVAALADDDFFVEGHRRVQDSFSKRWNWDVVHDCPLDGAWRWELINLPSKAATSA